MDRHWIGIDPELRIRLNAYLVEPIPSRIERFGSLETAFIVARIGRHIVFFDDVEEVFGTAAEEGGRLRKAVSYGDLTLALRELERSARPA